jgi:hypothetical protein
MLCAILLISQGRYDRQPGHPAREAAYQVRKKQRRMDEIWALGEKYFPQLQYKTQGVALPQSYVRDPVGLKPIIKNSIIGQ